jgi:hypothetical protein
LGELGTHRRSRSGTLWQTTSHTMSRSTAE